jgi:alkylation response protein AidB-like acyl-CoA dehydrogenase
VTEWKTQIQQYTTQTMSVINGEWRGIPLLPAAEYIILPLMPKNTLPFRLASFPLKNHATENISISKPLKTLGLRGCPQADIQFHHTLVNPENIIASGETIFESIKSLWSITEIIMMALRAGIAQSSYTAAYDYANQRHQGGKIIINHSLIKKMLADLYREKCIIDDGWRKTLESFSINKTLSTGQIGNALNSAEKLPWLTSDGIQILGGVGYMEDYFQEQRYRDAKHCEFLLGHLQARHFSLWYSELV